LWESVGTIKNSLCSEEKISLELYSQTNLLSFLWLEILQSNW
jgi:hypothetical protein